MADVDSQPKTVQSLYTWFSEGKLTVNRRYQRKLVWTLLEKQKLVESILNRYPVPAVLLAERGDGEYEIIDGLQRLFTIMSFIEGGFPTLQGTAFDIAQYPTAQTRANEEEFAFPDYSNLLTPRDVNVFLDYSMAVSVMRGASEVEIDDVFARINTYGHQLSNQERRQAGVKDDFSDLIRLSACFHRGDVSSDHLDLSDMPSISVDLPMTKHGYLVQADEIFWVKSGILRSTDLRDSLDEECLADIAASIVGGQILERSKTALDDVYEQGSDENARISLALDTYGSSRLADEIKYSINEVINVTEAGSPTKLRDLVFASRATTNAFPATFTVLVIAFHEKLVKESNQIRDYESLKNSLTDLSSRIHGRKTKKEDRRNNVDMIKGLLSPHVVPSASTDEIYGNHAIMDVDAVLHRSEIELPNYELKQGMLRLDSTRALDANMIAKVARTVCAIANNGPDSGGKILIGVTDKTADADRIRELDGFQPHRVGRRYVVGVRREAEILRETPEEYFGRWKTGIRNSELSEPLKSAVLSKIDYNNYYGLGVIIIGVPAQTSLSYMDGKIFWRDGDETCEATTVEQGVSLGARFAN
ncbi:GmrSD restriction endonuclease domain-containing protein [Brevibacterium zhoupengii]|uniref:GmrSD restriction endonuclease domain-containing protein n=1 Tax=Brevibacterium zhoupengii TaxID=2898795 RepID=UPI001E3994CA|nr:DUF262 domain-containing protein [Brevibacterium zhoupengii]